MSFTNCNESSVLFVRDLRKNFDQHANSLLRSKLTVKAVNSVTFYINPGETLGLVGESGCGKTTLGRLILRLEDPTDGSIFFHGNEISRLNTKEMLDFRKQIQYIFQDPFSSLNPRMRAGRIVAEPIENFEAVDKTIKNQTVIELFKRVGLNPEHLSKFPHEFSGGQRQRIGIARALASKPSLVVADEPVSALDVSVQAQVVNLLIQLQDETNMSYLFISHDLAIIQHIAHRVAVMYLGKIVEIASTSELFSKPLHPYTKALIAAVPIPDPYYKNKKIILKGDVPSPINLPRGCAFSTRCPIVKPQCMEQEPILRPLTKTHNIACHLVNTN